MPTFTIIFFAVLFATVFGGICYGLFFHSQGRVKAYRRLAEHLGAEFYEEGEAIYDSTLINLPMFQGKSSITIVPVFPRKPKTLVRPLVRKRQGNAELAIFDFHRLGEDVGEGRGCESTTVLAVKSPRFETPSVIELGPNSWSMRFFFSRFVKIDLAGFPKFSRNYLVRGADQQVLRELFDAEQIQFLEQLYEWRLKWRIEIGYGWVMCYQIAAHNPTKLERLAKDAWRIFGRASQQGSIAELQESSCA